MSKARREKKPARPQEFREPKRRLLIVTEGLTEKEYIAGVQRLFRNVILDLPELEIEGRAGVPMSVVKKAKKLKNNAESKAKAEKDFFLRFDEVWAFFDVDDHPDVANAKAMGRANGIECVVSNPCFELWLLLHFRHAPGMIHRDELAKILKIYLPTYNKHVDIEDYKDSISQAINRAEKLCSSAVSDAEDGRNPTTSVWRLIKVLTKSSINSPSLLKNKQAKGSSTEKDPPPKTDKKKRR